MMRRFCLGLIGMLFVVCPSFGFERVEDAFKKSYALVIGIDKYPSENFDDLRYAVKDAKAVEALLISQGFTVRSIYNEKATREAIVSYMENELAKLAGTSDRFLFFFAGHGHTEIFSGGTERGYVVPYDGREQSATYLSMASIRELSDILGVLRHQLFIMDCCYGGRLGSRGERTALDPRLPDYLDMVVKRRARQILTAGGATQRVQDTGPEGHSVFTGALLKAIQAGFGDSNGDGYISFYELSTYLQLAASRPNQTPGVDFLDGHEQGEFVFRNPVWRTSGAAVPEPRVGPPSGPTRGRPTHEVVKEGKQKFLGKDIAGARALFQEAADLGNAEAMFFLGVILFREGDPNGFLLVTEAAGRGHRQAMASLVDYYSAFEHFNPTEAERWKQEIAASDALALSTRLVDPTGGEASRGDPVVPASAVSLSPPRNLRIIQ